MPSELPPLVEHSELVKHVPYVVVELDPVHSSFGNWTIENRDSCPKHTKCKIKILFKKSESYFYFCSMCSMLNYYLNVQRWRDRGTPPRLPDYPSSSCVSTLTCWTILKMLGSIRKVLSLRPLSFDH